MNEISIEQVPRLRRGFRLQWEPVQNCHVLLYPEGMIKLNDSAGEFSSRSMASTAWRRSSASCAGASPMCRGSMKIILAFMEVASAQFWIELH